MLAARCSKWSWRNCLRILNVDDVAEGHGPEALRVFQRGFRLGQQGSSGSTKKKKNIPPVLDPPWVWAAFLKDSAFPGPSAARERSLHALRSQSKDPKEREALDQALRELYASAWQEDAPEEDREWAQAYRKVCTDWVNHHRWKSAGQSAYEGYLQSSDGTFYGEPAPPQLVGDQLAWRAFAERVENAPDDESELATAEAAAGAYWDEIRREAPPWTSDSAQMHWLAAVRAARKALAALAEYVPPPY
jgi:hypothetical protein